MDINNVLVMHHDNTVFDQIKQSFQEKKLNQFSFTLAKNAIQAETLLGMDTYDIVIIDVSWQFPNHSSFDHFLLDMLNIENTIIFYFATKEDVIFKSLHQKPRHFILNLPVDLHDVIWKLTKAISNKQYVNDDESQKVFSIEDFDVEKEKLVTKLQKSLQMDLRNPLTSVLIGSQALGRRFDEGSPEKSIIKELEYSIKKIKQIIDTFGAEEEAVYKQDSSKSTFFPLSNIPVVEKASVEII